MFYTKKSLGQNFLINEGVQDKIVSAAELKIDDTVLEIGPGTGNLTKLLSEKAGRVIAVEKDHRLIESLGDQFKNTNIEIVEEDILKLDIEELFRNLKLGIRNSNYKVIGNIPYYITSHLLKTIFERWPTPKLIVLMVQKEVAQRITAKPPKMNLLALSVQAYAEPKIVAYVSRGSFRPMPDVDSAVIRLVPKKIPREANDLVFRTIKVGFSSKRKQLASNLSKGFGIIKEDISAIFDKVGIEHDARAENLSLNQWKELSKLIKK